MNEENLILSVNTRYTTEEYVKFNKFHMFRKDNKFLKTVIVNVVILLALCIGYVEMKFYFGAIILCAIALFLNIFYFTTPKRYVRKILKTDKIFGKYDNTISFFDTYIEMKNEISDSKIKYEDLYKAYRYNNNIYIYFNKNSAILVLSKDVKEKDIDEIQDWLIKKLDKKFIKVN